MTEQKPQAARSLFLSMAIILLLALCPSCGNDSPSTPEVHAFKKAVRTQINNLSNRLSPLPPAEDRMALEKRLGDYFEYRVDSGGAWVLAVYVLEPDGTVRAGVYWEEGKKRGEVDSAPQDYAKYDALGEVLKSGRIKQGTVFVQGHGKLLIVAAPLPPKGKVKAVLVLCLSADALQATLGISEKVFLGINLNQ